jgi:hypothetical protein
MGLDLQGVKFLLGAQREGATFTRTATIGRQELFIDAIWLHRVLRSAGMAQGDAAIQRLLTEESGFAEPLLKFLGAKEICSIDASPYERASIVHDLNQPISDALKGAFTVVIDGGTLEHVFNFPVAIKNCMEMVEVGGHLLLMTPANNFMGHGFYQFSPELFFRVCSENNGFEIVRAIVCEVDANVAWYQVMDPARAGRRVELLTSRPTYLLIQARRVRKVAIFTDTPQQSDYTTLWGVADERPSARPPALKRSIPDRALRGLMRRAVAAYRMAEPSALARRRLRPSPEVFTKVNWLPGKAGLNAPTTDR